MRVLDFNGHHIMANFSLETCATSYERLYEAAVAEPASVAS